MASDRGARRKGEPAHAARRGAAVPAGMLGDERLARRAAAGDGRAFAAIYRRYHGDLYRYALSILGDRDDAEEALQATMVKAMRALPGERREIQLRPWLYRIAHNEAIELRRRPQRADPLGEEEVSSTPQPPEAAEQRDRLRALLADLSELSDRQRGALLMRELAGLGTEEIAAALDATPAVIRQALYEARGSLRQMEAGRDLRCERVTAALSETDGRLAGRRDLGAHLRQCPGCRGFQEEISRRRSGFAALGPVPPLAAAGALKALVAAKEGGGGVLSGMAGLAAAKSTATVAVVAALGVSVAEREGWLPVPEPGAGPAASAPPVAASPPGTDRDPALAAAKDGIGERAPGRRASVGGRGARSGGTRDGADPRAPGPPVEGRSNDGPDVPGQGTAPGAADGAGGDQVGSGTPGGAAGGPQGSPGGGPQGPPEGADLGTETAAGNAAGGGPPSGAGPGAGPPPPGDGGHPGKGDGGPGPPPGPPPGSPGPPDLPGSPGPPGPPDPSGPPGPTGPPPEAGAPASPDPPGAAKGAGGPDGSAGEPPGPPPGLGAGPPANGPGQAPKR